MTTISSKYLKPPYKSGLPVDKIRDQNYSAREQEIITKKYQSIIGSLNWLAVSTRPDISTITNMLAKYASCATHGHVSHARHVVRYLKGTKTLGISFHSRDSDKLQSFLKFPIDKDGLTSLCDANWGPQDQSKPSAGKEQPKLDLFKSRSISGYLIWLGGPIHWTSKRQAITARSSAEAEIYATDECIKQLIHINHILEDLNLIEEVNF